MPLMEPGREGGEISDKLFTPITNSFKLRIHTPPPPPPPYPIYRCVQQKS